MADHAQIVGDEQVRQAELLLEVLEEVENLRLHAHVERRDGLVADDEVGVDRERAGDADALALAAGEFVRVAVVLVGSSPTASMRSATRSTRCSRREPSPVSSGRS